MTSLDQFISESARSYLQSVVYVDDKIYLTNASLDEMLTSGIPVARDPFAATENLSDVEPPTSSDGSASSKDTNQDFDRSVADLAEFHPKELMESFAKMGIVCALYEPSEGELVNTDSQIYNLCQKADIVILDWDLFNDGGSKVSELLSILIKQSASAQPHYVRLCSIYTNQPDLPLTAGTLLETLVTTYGCTDVQFDEESLQLVSGATRISILGKPRVPGRPSDVETQFVVEERKLAERVLRDFCEMHKGLLSGLALKGLSSIRMNTKRLLDKFSCNLDGAFLLHRALVKHDREALDELPELLADELSAIIEDSLMRDFDYESVTNEIIDSLRLADPGDGKPYSEAAIRQELKDGLSRNVKKSAVLRYGVMVGDSEHSSSEKLGHLFINRTQYLEDSPSLKFGTVVKHRKSSDECWEYSVCLMPICDSRRRSSPEAVNPSMSYPFWRLNKAIKSTESSLQLKYAIVVEDQAMTISLGMGGKIRDMLWLADVRLGEDGWARAPASSLRYEAVDAVNEIQWVAQLKPLHAQRISSYVGSEASRVGLIESDWLRRLCDKN
jgi:hypothetical protein